MTMPELFLNGAVTLLCGDCREHVAALEDDSLDSCCTDPPYALESIRKRFGADGAAPAKPGVYGRSSGGFMGQKWDTGEVAFDPEFWALVWRKLKPGAYLAAFSGTRTYHRMATAIEDAGFDIRDQIGWLFGSGFPKSHDIAKAIDKAAGATRKVVGIAGRSSTKEIGAIGHVGGDYMETEPATDDARKWQGFGTAIKPAWEPICLAQKPISEKTIAANVLRWGVGGLNIDGCRVGTESTRIERAGPSAEIGYMKGGHRPSSTGSDIGRWPANVIHDGSAEVVGAFPDSQAGGSPQGSDRRNMDFEMAAMPTVAFGDSGSAARFFYTAKADAEDRIGAKHPTVKPVDLMQYVVRLITPPSGLTLDPFAGTGTTGEAAFREGMRAIIVEREPTYQDDIRRRMEMAFAGRKARARKKHELKPQPPSGGMFEDE